MALNSEKLKGSTALASLSEEQISAIVTLSENDEEAVLAKRIGDVHGDYDRDIESVTGLKKPQGVKTYDWLKNDILPKTKKNEQLAADLKKAQDDKKLLEEQLKEGKIDEATKQKLDDQKKLIADLQSAATASKEAHEKALKAAQDENQAILLNNEFDKALLGVKFKDETQFPKEVRDSFLTSAKQSILAENTPDWIDDGNGGKKLVFRDATGEIKRNSENALNPFTLAELYTKKIAPIIDPGKKQTGAGTDPKGKGGPTPATLDLSGADTQVKAHEEATTYLMSKGLERGSDSFTQEFDKICADNKVNELPLR